MSILDFVKVDCQIYFVLQSILNHL